MPLFNRLQSSLLSSIMFLTLTSASLQSASAATPTSSAPSTIQAAEPAADIDSIFNDLQKLVKEFYPKVKMTMADKKLHFAYRTRDLYGYNRTISTTPLSGGIFGEVSLVSGAYDGADKALLPSDAVEGDSAVLVMAPLSRSRNAHLWTRLVYPTDVPADFKERFKNTIKSFNANDTIGLPSSSGPVEVPQVQVKKQAPEAIFKNVAALVKEFYPQATVKLKGNTMHFERKQKQEYEYYTRKLETTAEPGGIVGDLELGLGQYKGRDRDRLPTETFQGFRSTILMAPYSKALNTHLYAKVVCPTGTTATFKTKFRAEIDSFNAGE